MRTYNEHLEDAAKEKSSIDLAEIETLCPPIYRKIVRGAAYEYAKEQSMAFVGWVFMNHWRYYPEDNVWGKKMDDGTLNIKTTSQLYDIFNELNKEI